MKAFSHLNPVLQDPEALGAGPGTQVGTLLYAPTRRLLMAFLLLSLVCLGGVVFLNLRTVSQLDAIRNGLDHLHQIQTIGLELTRLQVVATQGEVPGDSDVERLHRSLLPMLDPSVTLDVGSAQAFRAASAVLLDRSKPASMRLALSQRELRDATFAEVGASALRLERAVADSRAQAYATVAAIAVLPMAGLLAFVVLQRRVAGGLRELHQLLLRLAEGRFVPVRLPKAEPMLQGLFENYNRTVSRLDELEREHRERALTLEREVRRVTQRLMEQQGALARGERLAAVGQLAATIAHELRNPLAGIQLAVANIRDSSPDGDLRDRAAAVLRETQRMGKLLQDLLSPVRPLREAAREVVLADLLGDFAGLAIYQAPERVTLRVSAPPGLRVQVPAEGLRQALLNLVLNAFQAMRGLAGEVVVSVSAESGRLVVRVRDQGPGFPPAILREGVQLLRSNREGGTGLGLAVVQRFAADNGGDLAIGNGADGGAEVVLSLPMTASSERGHA
ncbi:MAG: HAMP domain-containing histidine kinase [Pseudomonadota bacterium]|nr:HAMP domain-containing histidine kinase [Pseudomonadota bacterium]